MKYFSAKAPNPETGEMKLRPNWFSVEADTNFAKIACEEYLKTKDAKRNKAEIVMVEITEI